MIRAEGVVCCDLHGEIHDETGHPPAGAPTRHDAGRPVWIDAGTGEVVSPECGPDNWRRVWIGGSVCRPRRMGESLILKAGRSPLPGECVRAGEAHACALVTESAQ